MDYKNHYEKLIDTRLKLQETRKQTKEKYFEQHHIIPKCIGGSNRKSNLLLLTAREHFIAHWLLWKIHGGKLIYALVYMSNGKQKNRYRFTARQYEIIKRENSKITSNRFSGKKHHYYGAQPWETGRVKNNEHFVENWKKLNIVYDIWIANDKPKGLNLKYLLLKSNLFNERNEKDRMVFIGSMINWFKKNGNPTKNDDWVEWINNNKWNITTNFKISFFSNEPWETRTSRSNNKLKQIYLSLDKIYDIWLKIHKKGRGPLARHSTHLFHGYKLSALTCLCQGLINWFKKNGDPREHAKWNQFIMENR